MLAPFRLHTARAPVPSASPNIGSALAAAGLVHPVRLVEVGAVRRPGEQGAFADELEVTPGQQRIACHVVLRNEECGARELRLEALIRRVRAHASDARLVEIVAGKLMLIVSPNLQNTGPADV